MALTLDTPRLVLREPVETDARVLLEYYNRNENRLARWEPEHVDDIAQQVRWIAWRRGESATEHGRSFLAFDRDDRRQLVAVINLYDIARGHSHSAVLGYSLDGEYEGRSYAREAVEAVVRYAFEVLHLHRITANYQPSNERSAALLRRLGFVVEGYARDLIHLRGVWRDHVLTSLTNPAWKPPEG